MKTIIKTAIFLFILGIFAFSTNPTVTSVREGSLKYGKMAYEKVVESFKGSENETLKRIGQEIE